MLFILWLGSLVCFKEETDAFSTITTSFRGCFFFVFGNPSIGRTATSLKRSIWATKNNNHTWSGSLECRCRHYFLLRPGLYWSEVVSRRRRGRRNTINHHQQQQHQMASFDDDDEEFKLLSFFIFFLLSLLLLLLPADDYMLVVITIARVQTSKARAIFHDHTTTWSSSEKSISKEEKKNQGEEDKCTCSKKEKEKNIGGSLKKQMDIKIQLQPDMDLWMKNR